VRATQQLRDPDLPSGLSPTGLLVYLLLVLRAFAVRSLSLPISMFSFPEVSGRVHIAASTLMVVGTLVSLGAVVLFVAVSEGFSASPRIGVRISCKCLKLSKRSSPCHTYRPSFTASSVMSTLVVDILLGLVLPYLLLPLAPGERSPVAAAAVSIVIAALNYQVWRTADQVCSY